MPAAVDKFFIARSVDGFAVVIISDNCESGIAMLLEVVSYLT